MSSGSNATTRGRSPDGEQNGTATLHDQPRRIREFLDEPVREDLPPEKRIERLEGALGRYIRDQIHDTEDEGEASTASDGGVDREEFEALQTTVQQLQGLADGQESTQTKRVIDLCIGLRNQAESREAGVVQWTYRDVLDHWERTGHGELDGKQAYRAMETATDLDGFTESTNDGGTRVLRCVAGSAPSDVEAAVDNVNNGSGGGTSADTGELEVNTSASR